MGARVKLEAGKQAVLAARAEAPRDLYVLGSAALDTVADTTLPAKLSYPGPRTMWDAELPKVGGDAILRAVLYARLIDEAGLTKPPGGVPDLIIEVEKPGGRTAQESFRRLSLEELEAALAFARKRQEPPPPELPALEPAAPPAAAPPPAAVIASSSLPVPLPTTPPPQSPSPVATTPVPPVSSGGPLKWVLAGVGLVLALIALYAMIQR
jgi:hypothetical protein